MFYILPTQTNCPSLPRILMSKLPRPIHIARSSSSTHLQLKQNTLCKIEHTYIYIATFLGLSICVRLRDQFGLGGRGLLPEYFIQCLPENQVLLPEFYVSPPPPKIAILKNSRGGGGLQLPAPVSYGYGSFKDIYEDPFSLLQ